MIDPSTRSIGRWRAMTPPGSTLSRCDPSSGPPCRMKYHHGMPFWAVTKTASGPHRAGSSGASGPSWCAFMPRMTRSCWPTSAMPSVARTRATSSRPSVWSFSPRSRTAARCAPRTTTLTSSPEAASFTARSPPMAPAPTTQILEAVRLRLGHVAGPAADDDPELVRVGRAGLEQLRDGGFGHALPDSTESRFYDLSGERGPDQGPGGEGPVLARGVTRRRRSDPHEAFRRERDRFADLEGRSALEHEPLQGAVVEPDEHLVKATLGATLAGGRADHGAADRADHGARGTAVAVRVSVPIVVGVTAEDAPEQPAHHRSRHRPGRGAPFLALHRLPDGFDPAVARVGDLILIPPAARRGARGHAAHCEERHESEGDWLAHGTPWDVRCGREFKHAPGVMSGRVRRSGTCAAALALAVLACSGGDARRPGGPTLRWYANPDNGGQARLAARCTAEAGGRWRLEVLPLPSDASQQREQLVRRLAARDVSIDLMSLDLPFVPELAEAGFLRPFTESEGAPLAEGVLRGALASATWRGRLVAAPFTASTQLLWFRRSVAAKAGLPVGERPVTWRELIAAAERTSSTVAVQANRYEGYMVWVTALVASAGGRILENAEAGKHAHAALDGEAGRRAAAVIRALARSAAADPALSTADEEAARATFQGARGGFMVNWPYVHGAAQAAPAAAARLVADVLLDRVLL